MSSVLIVCCGPLLKHLIEDLSAMDRARLALYGESIQSLAKAVAADQLAICARCILRYCNVTPVFSTNCSYEEVAADLISLLAADVAPLIEPKLKAFCNACLNVLADSFAIERSIQILDSVQANGYSSVADFQLQIHLPIALTLRDHYFQKKYRLDGQEIIGIKELFKVLLTAKLSKVMGVQMKGDSSFVIELTFSHETCDKECDQLVDIAPDTFYAKKCRKSSAGSFVNHSSVLRVISQLDADSISQLKLTQVQEMCTLSLISLQNEPIYIAGRYRKLSRKLSQTPWIMDDEMIMSSVQERITSGVERFISYKEIKFSSSGREDVDVRMLGRGRPFMLELLNPRFLTTIDNAVGQIQAFINETYEDVKVRDLQIVDKVESQKFLKEGEDSKTKTYQALCCLSRPFTEKDFALLNSTTDLVLTQKTPIRVLHRRTLSDRTRTVYKMWTETVNSDELEEQHRPFADRIFKLNLTTEAGTYIKEFVHSDFGRTTPNLCTLLGDNCSADILSLDVMEVNVNWPPAIDGN